MKNEFATPWGFYGDVTKDVWQSQMSKGSRKGWGGRCKGFKELQREGWIRGERATRRLNVEMVVDGESAVIRQCCKWVVLKQNDLLWLLLFVHCYQRDSVKMRLSLGFTIISPGALSFTKRTGGAVGWGAMSLYREIIEEQHLGVTRGIPHRSQPQRASPDAAPTGRRSTANWAAGKRMTERRHTVKWSLKEVWRGGVTKSV